METPQLEFHHFLLIAVAANHLDATFAGLHFFECPS